MSTHDEAESKFNPKRRLCPDGSCIGILGSDGKCNVCGVAGPGGASGEPETPDEASDDPSKDAILAEDQEEVVPGQADESGPTFDPNRRLCSDDACIGVIRGDNRCSVCGKHAES